MKELTWLLVGAGDISHKRVAPALAAADRSRIVGICDFRRELAEELASNIGVENVYSDLAEAIDESEAEAVYIATPVWLHATQTAAVLASGRHALVEKPMGIDVVECQRAVDAARRNGRTAACAYFRRLSPRYRYAKQMLADGEFGKVVSVRMNYFTWFNPPSDHPKHWRVQRAKSGGGPLSDMGAHMFDVLIGLLGMPVSVYAQCENLVHNWDVEDSAAVIMKMADGALVTAAFNWNSRTWRHEFEIVGTEAKLDWLPYDSGPVTKTVGSETETIILPNSENVHLPLVEDFVRAVLDGITPVCPLEEAIKTNIVLGAVYQSVAENRPVEIPQT